MDRITIAGREYSVTRYGGNLYACHDHRVYYVRSENSNGWQDHIHPGGVKPSSVISQRYPNHLPPHVYDGSVGGIRIHWGPTAIQRMQDMAKNDTFSVETMKALSEHFAHSSATRLGKPNVKITSHMKNYTVSATDGIFRPDVDHITVSFTRKMQAHICLEGMVSYSTPSEAEVAFDNIRLMGESIMTSEGSRLVPNRELSIGSYPAPIKQAAASTRPTAFQFYHWHDDPTNVSMERRWSTQNNTWERRVKPRSGE